MISCSFWLLFLYVSLLQNALHRTDHQVSLMPRNVLFGFENWNNNLGKKHGDFLLQIIKTIELYLQIKSESLKDVSKNVHGDVEYCGNGAGGISTESHDQKLFDSFNKEHWKLWRSRFQSFRFYREYIRMRDEDVGNEMQCQ